MSAYHMIPFISQLPEAEQTIWIAALNRALPDERVIHVSEVEQVEKKHCQLAIVANPKAELLAEFENLTWLHSIWAGVEKLMISLADSPIEVVRLIDPRLSSTMAEAALAWTLYLHRDMPRYAKQQQNKHWQQHPHILASERRIGILGLGELGQASAKQLRKNGFQVLGWSRTKKHIANVVTYSDNDGLAEMLSKSDILLCLLPLTPATQGLVDKAILANLPQGSAIINFARGGLIDNDALICALNSKHISHAVLDVFDHEPLAPDSVFWQHPDITVLPHISAPTNQASACDIVAKNIMQYRQTGIIPVCVDKTIGY